IGAGRDEIYCGFRDLSSIDILGGLVADQVGEPASVLRAMTEYLRQSQLIITVDGRYTYKDEIFDYIRRMRKGLEGDSDAQPIFLTPALNISAILAQRAALLIKENRITPVKPHYIRRSDAEIKRK